MPLPAGARLGPYEVTGPLGAGGMGEVYRARDTRLDRTVAVKVLPEAVAADVERRARFEREAKMISALNHPNICALFDVGEQDGVAYLVMELLEGETLAARLRRGPLPLEQTLRFGRQIADALGKAHALGIVHRDLKPGNVMVAKGGVKLLDFGLAKKHREPPGASAARSTVATESRPLTTDGALLGTYQYMAPEQLERKDADARSDVWALGCVLYEMATGTRPFKGKGQASLIGAILSDEPRPIAASDRLAPPALDRLVRRCLAKDPDERWSSAHDVALALADIEAPAAPSDTARPPARRAIASALLVLAGLALGAAAAWAVLGRKPATADAGGIRFHRVTYRPGTVYAARFTPDGQSILYTAAWGGGPPELFLGRQGTPEARPLGFPGTKLLGISSRGEIALFRGRVSMDPDIGTIFQTALTGGAPRDLVESAHLADWTPDGQLAVLVHVDGARERLELPIGTRLADIEHATVSDFRISPDGSRAAFTQLAPTGRSLHVVARDGSRKEVVRGLDFDGTIAWSPAGDEVWLAIVRDDVGPPSLHAVTLDGRVRPLLVQSGWTALHDVTRDGRALVATHSWRGGIAFGRAAEPTERPLGWLDRSAVVALSADGGTILFNETREGGGEDGSIYLRKTDGSPAVRLGEGHAADLSPDGRWVLAVRRNTREFFIVPTGAGAPRALPLGGLHRAGNAAFVGDGARIVFGAREGVTGPRRIYVMDVATGASRAIGGDEYRAFARAITPDGRAVACTDVTLTVRMWCPLDGGPAVPLPHVGGGETPIHVSRDGRHILVAVDGSVPRRIEKVDLSTGARTPWRSLAPADRTGVDEVLGIAITPDESAWAYSYDRTLSDLYVVEGLR